MNTKLLIDSVVQQTTVLIAQLSTSAGIRAPLAHVADRVFVDLAGEIEAQGVGRKVVADMFGLALRTYQKKVQRLTESAARRDKTLWQAVLELLQEGPTPRRRVLERFELDGVAEVAAVLNDLVNSGLAYATGRGEGALYGVTSEADRAALAQRGDLDAATGFVWLAVHVEEPISEQELALRFSGSESLVQRAVERLLTEGTLSRDEAGLLRANNFVVPLGSEMGWEAAVFDHFRAVCNAVAAKLRSGATRAEERDVIGGATLSFAIHPKHPHRQEVLNLLASVRGQLGEVWQRVSEHNQREPVSPEELTTVTFYFGQSVNEPPPKPQGGRTEQTQEVAS